MTSVVLSIDPPGPAQVSTKVEKFVSVEVDSLPLAALEPSQSPDAVQVVTSDVVQLSVALWLVRIKSGVASNTSDGAMFTVTACEALPPMPVHESENVVGLVRGPIVSEPDVAFVPVQPLDAVQSDALALDQFSVADSPDETTSGLVVRETVVTGCGGTVGTGADCPPPPPQPEATIDRNAVCRKRSLICDSMSHPQSILRYVA